MTFIFFNLTFGPMHIIGLQGMPRRVADYAEQFAGWNLFISIASFFVGVSTLVFVYNMVSSWRGGPRAGQPVARADARVAGVLAAADLQLRRPCRPWWAGRTSTAYPGAVHGCSRRPPRPSRCRPAASRRGRRKNSDGARVTSKARSEAAKVLVVANETLGGRKLMDVVHERARAGDVEFALVVPQQRPRHGGIIYDEAVRDTAQVRDRPGHPVPAQRGHRARVRDRR